MSHSPVNCQAPVDLAHFCYAIHAIVNYMQASVELQAEGSSREHSNLAEAQLVRLYLHPQRQVVGSSLHVKDCHYDYDYSDTHLCL